MKYYEVINRNEENIYVEMWKNKKDMLSKTSKSQNIFHLYILKAAPKTMPIFQK